MATFAEPTTGLFCARSTRTGKRIETIVISANTLRRQARFSDMQFPPFEGTNFRLPVWARKSQSRYSFERGIDFRSTALFSAIRRTALSGSLLSACVDSNELLRFVFRFVRSRFEAPIHCFQ